MAKKALDQMTKDELLDEVKRRNKAGRDIKLDANANKADLLAALELDDEATSEDNAANLLPGEPVELDALPAGMTDLNAQAPTAAQFVNEGKKFLDRDSGEEFLALTHEPDCYGRTHSAMNRSKTWQGTEAEFIQKFEKP